MSSWQGKSRGTPLGYKIFIWILKKGGLTAAYFLLKFVTFYYFLFSYISSKNIIYFYRKRLGFSWVNSIRFLYKNYYSLGQSLIDKVIISSGIPNHFTFDFDGEEHLRKIVETQKGGILISGHIGSWDIAGYLLNRLETPINIVIYDGEAEALKKYTSIANKKKINIIPIKDDLTHIFKISEAFQRNELICMHADRFIEGNKTISVNFLGKKASFPMGPFLLASTFKVPISFVFALKESKFHYHLFATNVINLDGLKREAIIDTLLNKFVEEMETKIKLYPNQWYNYYNFWK